jgi:hypothetical protein
MNPLKKLIETVLDGEDFRICPKPLPTRIWTRRQLSSQRRSAISDFITRADFKEYLASAKESGSRFRADSSGCRLIRQSQGNRQGGRMKKDSAFLQQALPGGDILPKRSSAFESVETASRVRKTRLGKFWTQQSRRLRCGRLTDFERSRRCAGFVFIRPKMEGFNEKPLIDICSQ